jgi:hypothetical protein
MRASPAGETTDASVPAMLLSVRNGCVACMVFGVGLGAGLLGAMPVVGQPPPQQVISDTPEYCLRLADRLSELARAAPNPPSYEITSLSIEGQRMCNQGQTRGGLLRLRRALALMLQNSNGDDDR